MTFVALSCLLVYDGCWIITLVDYDVCRIMPFVTNYDVCRFKGLSQYQKKIIKKIYQS